MSGQQDQRQVEERGQQRQPGDGDVDGDDIGHRLAQVVEDAAAQAHGLDDRVERVIQQHHRRRLARDIRAASAHRDADVRRFEGGGVVHAVAGHGDDLAIGLEAR